jgi:xylose isomerase
VAVFASENLDAVARKWLNPHQDTNLNFIMMEATQMAYKLAAGVWCDNPGASRFGEATRTARTIEERIKAYKKLGLSGIEAHDNEITSKMAPEIKKLLDRTRMRVALYTANFFWNKKYTNGALASHDPKVRKEAVEQLKRAIDTAHVLEADVLVYWNGQEGQDVAFGKDGLEALGYLRDAFNEALEYDATNYGDKAIPVAIEPKPNEPRCSMLLPTVGDAIAFSYSLDPRYQAKVGVNPEVAHSIMVGLDYTKDIETAFFHNKLFHIHLNDQEGPKYDQDLPFAAVNAKRGLEIIACLKNNSYGGWVSFDLNPLRTDAEDKRNNIIKACMANFKRLSALADKLDWNKIKRFRRAGDFSGLDMYIDSVLLSA